MSSNSDAGGRPSGGQDPHIAAIQAEVFERSRLTHRWMIVAGLDGYEVHDHTIDGVAPPTVYPTKAEAAARLLQLLGLNNPITPQTWPERICIGEVQVNDEPTKS